MKESLRKGLKVVGNKYVVATVVFLLIILFIDDNNLMVTSRIRRQVNALHAEEAALKEAIAADSLNAISLKDNMDAKEHYGRENYYMKRADEDIFVVK